MSGAEVEKALETGSIAEIGGHLRAHRVSAREITSWYLARAASIGLALNAIRSLSPHALEDAGRADAELAAGKDRGPLHGIPILVKDNILTADGLPASAGAAALASFVPTREATLVRRLRAAGAILLGKTNMTEFADYVSDVMPSGFSGAGGVVKNPHGQEYGRGQGSSVGSAAAVAAALAPVAIGSETQNSIQTPASHSSVVGLKPSVGLVSRSGIVPLVPSQDSPGPLARSVADARLVLSVIAGADSRDSATLSGLRLSPAGGFSGTVILGVPRRAMADREDFASVMPAFEAALSRLSLAGIRIVDPCDIPSAEQLRDVRSSVFRTEFKAALDTFLEDRDAPSGIGSLAQLIAWNEKHPEAIPYGQSLLIAAQETAGLDDAVYLADRARDVALSLAAGIDAAIAASGVDALILPMGAGAKCTGKAGAPVVAIPVGLDATGTPFGITLFSSWGSDARLIEVALRVEDAIGDRRLPAL